MISEELKNMPIGTEVSIRRSDGTKWITKTRTAPQLLSGHTWVVWVEGHAACYSLGHVSIVRVPA